MKKSEAVVFAKTQSNLPTRNHEPKAYLNLQTKKTRLESGSTDTRSFAAGGQPGILVLDQPWNTVTLEVQLGNASPALAQKD